MPYNPSNNERNKKPSIELSKVNEMFTFDKYQHVQRNDANNNVDNVQTPQLLQLEQKFTLNPRTPIKPVVLWIPCSIYH